MTVFLTSSPTGCPFDPGPAVPVLDPSNGFVDRLRDVWPATPPACLMLASDPDSYDRNDQMRGVFEQCFAEAGLPFSRTVVCDRRNAAQFSALLANSGFVILCGGHVPTQNRFFACLGAAAALQAYTGIVLGISAGTMNAADPVYAQPEEPGEASNPAFERWLPGLGLTRTNVLPHFQMTRSWTVDGLRLLEDIALPDSFRRPLVALPDGSYLLVSDGVERLYGEAWLLRDGQAEHLCADGLPIRALLGRQ